MPELIVRIDVYKSTGKWYTGHVATNPTDIPIHDANFKKFVREHLPAHYAGGYVVVTDCANGQGFHNHLFQYNELMGIG